MTPQSQLTFGLLCRILGRYSFHFANEEALQRGIASCLEIEGVRFEREVIDGKNRYDFLCGRVAVEVKMDRSASELLRQIDRYCESERIDAVVVAATKPWAHPGLVKSEDGAQHATMRGKPLAIVRVRGRAF